LIDWFGGRPWLWARHDIKPNKIGDKKFREFENARNARLADDPSPENIPEESVDWDISTDFKEFPDDWKSASGRLIIFLYFI